MPFPRLLSAALAFVLTAACPALAHFGMLLPDQAAATLEHRDLRFTVAFAHPAERRGMDMARPVRLHAAGPQGTTDLLPSLTPARFMDHEAWVAQYQVKRPGVYRFALEPAPYWEPAEDIYIVHYTKVVVPAFGADSGWDEPLGLPVEIVPLTRPFGNYEGNSFSGRVLANGRPLAGVEVEVERLRAADDPEPVSDYHVTQVTTTDDSGVFTFTCPLPGWWGFAALHTADATLDGPDGKPRQVEQGGVMWIYLDPLPR